MKTVRVRPVRGMYDRAAAARRLREAREQAGLTREQVSDLMASHPHPGTVKNWENPRDSATPFEHFDELSRLYQVGFWWLMHGEEHDPMTQAVREEVQELRRLLDQFLRGDV